MDAPSKRLKAARDEQLAKVACNEEDLQHMRETAAEINHQREEAAALAACATPPKMITLEDEIAVGADAGDFTTKKNKNAKTPPQSTVRRVITPARESHPR